MSRALKAIVIVAIFSFGYLAGTENFLRPAASQAEYQKDAYGTKKPAEKKLRLGDLGLSKETLQKVRAAHDSLAAAMEALKLEGKYASATEEMNAFLVLSGGGNPIEDLESGRGVDPETFSALHVGDAVEEVKEHLGKDARGRLTYKNKLIRLIPVKRLKESAARRLLIRESLIQSGGGDDF